MPKLRRNVSNVGVTCPECGEPATCRGYCNLHYGRLKRGMPLDADLYNRSARKALGLEKLWARIDRRGPDECWTWAGPTIGPKKYPQIRYGRCVGYDPLDGDKSRQTYPHRLIYMYCVGPIPEGMTVDHKCFNSLCCNPAHMQLLTRSQNSSRKSPEAREKARRHLNALRFRKVLQGSAA